MRGAGIKIKKTFSWVRQPDGNYTIFDVPFLKPFKRVYPDGTIHELKESDFPAVMERFEKDMLTGHYPRVHKGHQDLRGTDNAPGVGYIGSLYFQGDTFFGDLTDIKPADFEKIEDLPYRSVEFEMNEYRIASLALLESRNPYFILPMLRLDKAPRALEKDMVLAFERRSQLQLGGRNLTKDEEKKDADAEDDQMECPLEKKDKEFLQDDLLPEDIEPEGHMEEEMSELGALKQGCEAIQTELVDLGRLVRQIHEFLFEDESKGGDEPQGEADMAEPSSVAQNAALLEAVKEMSRNQAQLQKQVAALAGQRNQATCESRLKEIVENNPTLHFESHLATMNKFSSAKDKNTYLDTLALMPESYPAHFASHVASRTPQQFSRDDIIKKLKEDKIELTPQLAQLAKRAQVDYRDTATQPNVRDAEQFCMQYPTAYDFVKMAVTNEINIPGSYDRMV